MLAICTFVNETLCTEHLLSPLISSAGNVKCYTNEFLRLPTRPRRLKPLKSPSRHPRTLLKSEREREEEEEEETGRI